jgi:hypothetical protein
VISPVLSQAAGSDFLRITCIPETRYFSVEYKQGDVDEDRDGLSRAEVTAQERAWKRQGYHDPGALSYDCRLPESTYRLTSTHSRSRSGELCDIALTLNWNDEVWLDGVHIGPTCGNDVSLDSFEIWDGRRTARKPRSMTLCIGQPSGPSGNARCEHFQPHPTQRRVEVVTQRDLEEYVAARNAPRPESAGGSWKRDTRSLNQFLFIRHACEFPGLQLPADAVVHVLVNGDTRELPFGIDPGNSRAYVGDVFVNLPGKRVALVMVGNSGPTVWNFHWTRSTEIVAVAAMGSSKLVFAGLPKATPVFSGHFGSGTACKYFSASPGFPDSERQEVAAFAQQMYHRPPETITHFRFSAPAAVGDRLPATGYVKSRDVTVESFATQASELIGAKGVEKLELDGAIRKATQADAAAWLAAWKAAHPAIAKRYTASDQELLRSIDLWMAFVIQRPFRYPTGLVGADRAVFFVPKGMPRPTGEQGHSILYDLSSGSCFATTQSWCQPFN